MKTIKLLWLTIRTWRPSDGSPLRYWRRVKSDMYISEQAERTREYWAERGVLGYDGLD